MASESLTSKDIGSRLRRLRQLKKIGLRELARRLRVEPNTLSRLETGKQRMSIEWLTKLSGALEAPISDLLEDSKYEGQVVVVGQACCNDWRETCWYPKEKQYSVHIPPDARNQYPERFAIEGHCPAMNLRYPEGSLIICAPLNKIDGGMVIGKRYLIESWRKKKGKKEYELTIKKLTADDEGNLWFVTESSHPAYQMSLPFGKKGDVAIKPVALVIGSMQIE